LYGRVRLDRAGWHTEVPVLVLNSKAQREFERSHNSVNVNSEPEPYEGAPALCGFSLVFFNKAHDVALVHATYYCGNLCAGGTWFALTLEHGTWESLTIKSYARGRTSPISTQEPVELLSLKQTFGITWHIAEWLERAHLSLVRSATAFLVGTPWFVAIPTLNLCQGRVKAPKFSSGFGQATGRGSRSRGTGRTVPLNQRALEVVKFWAQQFPNRLPEHYVFQAEKVGAAGDQFDAKVYETDPSKPLGSIKQAWESAKKRTRRNCPNCQGRTLADEQSLLPVSFVSTAA